MAGFAFGTLFEIRELSQMLVAMACHAVLVVFDPRRAAGWMTALAFDIRVPAAQRIACDLVVELLVIDSSPTLGHVAAFARRADFDRVRIVVAVFAAVVAQAPVADEEVAAEVFFDVAFGAGNLEVSSGECVVDRLVVETRGRTPEVGGMALIAPGVCELGTMKILVA